MWAILTGLGGDLRREGSVSVKPVGRFGRLTNAMSGAFAISQEREPLMLEAQVVDPIGLVPMVKQVGQLTEVRRNNRPPRARHVGEGGCGLTVAIGAARQPDSPSGRAGWGLRGLRVRC